MEAISMCHDCEGLGKDPHYDDHCQTCDGVGDYDLYTTFVVTTDTGTIIGEFEELLEAQDEIERGYWNPLTCKISTLSKIFKREQ